MRITYSFMKNERIRGNGNMNILAPSLLAVDYNNIEANILLLEESNVSWLHLDVMDGYFVPNISFGEPVIRCIRKITKLYFDVHLMVINPIRYIDDYVKAGADSITVHYEACEDLSATIAAIKAHNIKVGVSIKPDTPVSLLKPYMNDIDLILVMSVEPGFGGQAFMPSALDKLSKLKQMVAQAGRPIDLEVDGGITIQNVKQVIEAGANVIVSGSSVFKGNVVENVERFSNILTEN